MTIVRTGLDHLLDVGPTIADLGAGSRIGLLAHPASVDHELVHAVDRIVDRDDLELVRIFAPEHGFGGELQDMVRAVDARDERSGVDVVSLYGATAGSLRPSEAALDGLDAVVCDLQDVGSRYYTYVYTISYVMEAAAETGTPVVVLDRPNPLGGVVVEGAVLDPQCASFVGRYPIPVRHGMTTGELARLFNDRFRIGCDLRVVPMSGWRRRMSFEDTGLSWVPPSPNMPTVDTAFVYPGGCLIEGTNLSEGRGTTRPFETVGAPWIDGRRLAFELSAEALPGVRFRITSFLPMFQKHAGDTCSGVAVHVVDRETFAPFRTYVALIRAARRIAPSEFDWRREPYEFEKNRPAIDLLLGDRGLREALEDGAPVHELVAAWTPALEAFRVEREPFLLYPF